MRAWPDIFTCRNDLMRTKRNLTAVYSGPMTQTKEQTGAVYGTKLADKGFIARL